MRARAALLLVGVVLFARDTGAQHAVPDYRYFRKLSIDLIGRAPSRGEIAAFERPDFSLDRWLDSALASESYAARVSQVYEDLLKLDLPLTTVAFRPPAILLRYTTIVGPDGKSLGLYFRDGQRRATPALDGQVCFSEAETGLIVPPDGPPSGTGKPVSKQLLEERTVLVKPWWLYADYRAAAPRDRVSEAWLARFGYELEPRLFVDPDGRTPTTAVRVCREEAQLGDTGHVFATHRVVTKQDALLPGRRTRLPADTSFARAHEGQITSCGDRAGFESTLECGCGVGLERCLPTEPNGFVMPWSIPLGVSEPFDAAPRPAILWLRTWLAEEPKHFLRAVFADDRDVRELLTSAGTQVNGPLAQFYRYFAGTTCCGDGETFGYVHPEPLFDPAAAPPLAPFDAAHWSTVADRGPHAAGLLTMPIFLLKYTSRRQRAHAAYSAFACKDFVAERVELKPSTEPDLTKRPGCAVCHRTLEPMAAAFARIVDSDWTYLPAATFPASSERCANPMSGACRTFYDADFADDKHAMLRGAAAAPAAADGGPRGLARELASSPGFAACVVHNVAESLLGRPMTSDDASWTASLAAAFEASGYRMRGLVRKIVTSRAYRDVRDRGQTP